ncbi:MAG TPA: hypothetical protein VFV99_11545, partial [Kofleriaceae bacterium]|nr:hypothetical protein [Kofleriaceae bacterium]
MSVHGRRRGGTGSQARRRDRSWYGVSVHRKLPDERPDAGKCESKEAPDSSPGLINEGCGDDENSCSAGGSDRDGAPVRFSSRRVETNPITVFSVPTPDAIFFGYRMMWGSHVSNIAAHKVGSDTGPTIHHSNEVTHFLGSGWVDDYSDRLFLNVRDKAVSSPPTI